MVTTLISVRKKELRKLGYDDFNDWIKDPNNIYIGRYNRFIDGTYQSKWHNPFSVKKYGRDGCIKKYREYIANNKELKKSLHELKGKTLGCWCYPEKCHGDVLIKLTS